MPRTKVHITGYTPRHKSQKLTWDEKISTKTTESLETRDRIYFVQRVGWGHGKWKCGIVLGRDLNVEINTGNLENNHIDTQAGTGVTLGSTGKQK